MISLMPYAPCVTAEEKRASRKAWTTEIAGTTVLCALVYLFDHRAALKAILHRSH